MSVEEAIAYAQRGRGKRKRANSGWALAHPHRARHRTTCQRGPGQQGHRHKAFRLTPQRKTHLIHVYTKLGLTSPVQLAQEAARHA